MKNTIKEVAIEKLHSIYGDTVDERIVIRLDKEIEALENLGKIEEITNVVSIVDKMKSKGELITPRLSLSNSLFLYLLGINNVNPLPRHTYCPKCHSFHWGDKHDGVCPYCGETLKEDGYDLDYELFIKDIERANHYYFSTSGKDKEVGNVQFVSIFELRLAKQLGLSQEDIDNVLSNSYEILKYINRILFNIQCKAQNLINHKPFIGLTDLSSSLTEKLCRQYHAYTFDKVVKILSMTHSTGLIDANKRIEKLDECITSRDDLYTFLKSNQFNGDDAYRICKEVRANGSGHLSMSSEENLKEAKVDNKYIDVIKAIRYIFHKGHIVSLLTLLVNLGKIYLEDPKRYYQSYFYLKKDIYDTIDKDSDLIDGVISSKATNYEDVYLGLIDLKERA